MSMMGELKFFLGPYGLIYEGSEWKGKVNTILHPISILSKDENDKIGGPKRYIEESLDLSYILLCPHT
ncbi:hypothetical protein Lal_00030201 [Lupinus albus]|nr:hypothetical protein Lal_00030201 [Lupinus albus]